jgi:peptidase E
MGGGGFSMEPENLLLDRYVLKASGKRKPKVCFVPTASGDAQGYIDRFYESFKTLPCKPSHLTLFRPSEWKQDLAGQILGADVLYVGGGNTFNMLTLWRAWGVDKLIRRAYRNGTVLAGLSAGAICWFEQGNTDSLGRGLAPMGCLGWLKGSCCPHYDGEAQRRPVHHSLMAKGKLIAGYAADDGVGLHFVNQKLVRIVSSRPKAKGYWVERVKGKTVETELETAYLG